jgi:hypothetical protein
MNRYPGSANEWLESARDLGRLSQSVMAKAAAEIGADELALEIRNNTDTTFPHDRYRRELNRRRRGAGNRAARTAGREFRRRRVSEP